MTQTTAQETEKLMELLARRFFLLLEVSPMSDSEKKRIIEESKDMDADAILETMEKLEDTIYKAEESSEALQAIKEHDEE
jgi:hypothetical protein